MDRPRVKLSEEKTRNYEKRATRRKIRSLHDAISRHILEDVQSLLTPDVDVNFHYGGQTALQIAVVKGYENICALLIKRGADVNKFNAEDNSLLNMAVWRGFTSICQLLVDNGAELDMRNNVGSSALGTAAYKGYAEIAKLLIKADCDIDSCNLHGMTPLCTAACEGHLDVIRVLLEGGCDVNWSDQEKKTALCIAAERGHTEVSRVLIQNGNCSLDHQEKLGATAVYLAADEGHKDIVDLLIQAGANLDITDHRGVSPVMVAVRSFKRQHLGVVQALTAAKCDVNIAESDRNQAPIHAAVRIATQFYGPKDAFTNLVQTLIEAGCDLDLGDKEGYTPLYQAAFGGETDIVSLLLKHTRSVRNVTTSGNTLLHGAVLGNKPEVLSMMLAAGCSVNATNKNNELPLFTAVDFRAKIEIVKQLLEAGSKTDLHETTTGHSPLFSAINNDYTEAVELLITAGASVNIPNYAGDTPLWVACNRGNKEIVTSLLKQPNIDINAGISHIPLHAAAAHGHYDIAETLLRAGADVNKLTDLCVSAVYLAADANHRDVVELLIRYGADPSAPARMRIPAPCCRHYRDTHPHFELEPLYAAVKNDNFQVIKLLLIATPRMPYYVIQTLKDLIFRTGFAQEARLSQSTIYSYASFFSSVLRKPSSLQAECRGVIRRQLGSRKQVSKVESLPLPNKIKDFLLFKGILLKGSMEEE